MSTKFSHRAKIGPTPRICKKVPTPPPPPGFCGTLPVIPDALTAILFWDQAWDAHPTPPPQNAIQLPRTGPAVWYVNAAVPPDRAIEIQLDIICAPVRWTLRVQTYYQGFTQQIYRTNPPFQAYDGPALFAIRTPVEYDGTVYFLANLNVEIYG